ncbi:MAG TPA: MBL fold metallo-hydrolase [Candidatus Dormibacteraeota bacterium]|nr:MBL fold metallo-hydrolase [Candidatus Dormibacteraeota bacterium]
MEIQTLGANTVRIVTKKTSIVVNDSMIDGKSHLKDDDIVLFSNKVENKSNKKTRLFISSAGEYEVADVLIIGIPAFSYKEDSSKKFNSTIFKLISDDASLAVIGDVSSELTDSQIEDLGRVDALIIPVGGNGITLDAPQALKIIKKIDPFVVIPVHYDDGITVYPTTQDNIEQVSKVLGLEVIETDNKFKLKSSDFIEGQATKLIVLKRV